MVMAQTETRPNQKVIAISDLTPAERNEFADLLEVEMATKARNRYKSADPYLSVADSTDDSAFYSHHETTGITFTDLSRWTTRADAKAYVREMGYAC